MAERSTFRVQVNDLWKQAVDQLEEVRDVLSRSRDKLEGRLEEDLLRLRGERDRLLKVLGEQTYKLANQGKVPLPTVVKNTVDRLNEVIESLVATQRRKSGKSSAAPTATGAAKKKTAAKASKKTTKKKAAKKKTTAKKT